MGDVRRNCWTCDLGEAMGCRSYTPEADAWWIANRNGRSQVSCEADGCPKWKPTPEQANTDRAQIASYGAIPVVVDPNLPEDTAIVVKRAEWDALIARIDELERVGAKTSRDVVRLRRNR